MAGAGSGKTAVLTARIARLQLKERVGTSNMLALTFTRLAAAEMKERVAKLIGEDLAKNLTAGTFHSFCVRVLRTYGKKIGVEPNFSVYDTEDAQAIMEAVINDLGLKSKVKLPIDPWEPSKDPFVSQVAKEYQYRLKRNNAIDLDGLLAQTVFLLGAHQDIANELRNRFTYVFVDEYQDTDSRQATITNLIDPQNLFVVGDPSQSIYGWRGAKIENILTFAEQNPGTEEVRMECNYRSSKPILKLANNVIEKANHKSPLQLWTDKEGFEVGVTCYSTEDSEAEAIATEIAERLAWGAIGGKVLSNLDGIKALEDVAILCRTNYQVEHYNAALQRAGLKTYVVSNNADPLKGFDARKIIDYMAYICNPRDGRALKHIINWPEQRMTDLQLHQAEMDATSNMQTLAEHLEDQLNLLTGWDIIEGWETDVTKLWDTVVKNIGLRDMYRKQNLGNRIDALNTAEQAISRWWDRQETMGESTDPYAFLRWMRTKDIQDKLAQEKPEGVQIMTVHAAKGLEWPHVYIPGCNKDVFPSKKGDIEEERRLFYVAVTRAKKTLNLSYYDQKETNWGKKQLVDMKPSPFLEAMGVTV